MRLWETATGAELLRLDGHEGEVTGVAFGADGRSCCCRAAMTVDPGVVAAPDGNQSNSGATLG